MDKDGFTVVVDEKKKQQDKRKEEEQKQETPNNQGKGGNKKEESAKTGAQDSSQSKPTQKASVPSTTSAPSQQPVEQPKQTKPKQEESTEPQEERQRKCPPNLVRKDLEFEGRVLEVVNGDCLVIESLKTKNRGRFFLANIRAPAAGNKNRQAKEYGYEAKELTRRLTIGKYVKVELEFQRKVKAKEEDKEALEERLPPKNPSGEEQVMNFCSITAGDQNVTQELLERGFVELIEPIFEQETSKYFDLYKKSYRPINATQKYAFPRFVDLTAHDSQVIMRAKELFSTLKDGNQRFHGVIQAVINGSRFKVKIPDQNTFVWFVLDGVRCLPNDENFPNFPKWSSRALDFSKDNMYQRDVEIQLASVDKKGVFHGLLSILKIDYAEKLLEQGFAVCFGRNVPSNYQNIEKLARDKRIGLWSEQDLNIEGFRGDSGSDSQRSVDVLSGSQKILVTEVVSAEEFFIQETNNNVLNNLMKDLSNTKFTSADRLVAPIKQNTPCIAVFSQDGAYYRAIVTVDQPNKNGKYRVFYTDFGNSEEVHDADLYKMPSKYSSLPPQAERCQLAYIRTPKPKTDLNLDCQEELSYLFWDVKKNLVAHFQYKERNTPYVLVNYEGESADKSVNVQLIQSGLAKIDEGVDIPEKLEQLFYDTQDIASEKKLGIWTVDEDND